MADSLNQQQISFIQRLVDRRTQLLDLQNAIERDIELYDELSFGAQMTDDALKTAGFDYSQSTVWNAVNAQRAYVASLDATPVEDEGKGVNKSDEAVRVSLIKLAR